MEIIEIDPDDCERAVDLGTYLQTQFLSVNPQECLWMRLDGVRVSK